MGYHSNHSTSKATRERQKVERLGEERLNYQGCLMKIIEYNKSSDIIVEFQDKRKTKIKCAYREFVKGSIKNPYHPTIYGVGMRGNKYPARVNGKVCREYYTWRNMLYKCFDDEYKEKYQTHFDAVCCEEWLCFENFYEWIHGQSNVENFLKGNNWILNRNIIDKDNEIYSPEYCCLVPQSVNRLFMEQELNIEDSTEEVLQKYKEYKEKHIKRVAEEEFANGNISEQCYKAMMDYEIDVIQNKNS